MKDKEKYIIELKNLSKFYYNKGVIATGFNKVNLKFKIGEFVAITGESGSGKSTLLNVISGLDTYEDGELYINGEETSHYSEKDFENYRRKYIGNIFQNFNLVNSYTVYQNIELMLLLNGNSKKSSKKRVLELIELVGLSKFRNTKVSKLSGGQKQRVAIARALAKETPIIIADEPTGNLDSDSAGKIIELLHKISKDKLVIIVTHNYDQVEKYVTRKIRMHDGRVLEDDVLVKPEENVVVKEVTYKEIGLLGKIRLGIRNTFNIIPKFVLLLAVYFFVTVALMAEYSAFKKQEDIQAKQGYNYIFNNNSWDRVIIKKENKSAFTDSDYENISRVANVSSIVRNDLFLDTYISITDDNYYLYGTVNGIENLEGDLDVGRRPTASNEVIVSGSKDDYYIGYMASEIIDKELYLVDNSTGELDKNTKLKLVGIKYVDNSDNAQIYVSKEIMDKLTYQVNKQYSTLRILFNDKYYNSSDDDSQFRILPSDRVKEGEIYISSEYSYLCKNGNCLNSKMGIDISNLYYSDRIILNVSNTYDKKNFTERTGFNDYDSYNGAVFISKIDYDKLFNRSNYQSSIFVKDVKKIDETVKELNNMGINTLEMKEALVSSNLSTILQIFRTIVTIILVVVLFFISYFVIKLILKSRNVYFTTIRMLGTSRKVAVELLIIELLMVANIAYFTFIGVIGLEGVKIINVGFIETIINYMKVSDYVILYLILIGMSYLISLRFARKLFKKSVMITMKEEV